MKVISRAEIEQPYSTSRYREAVGVVPRSDLFAIHGILRAAGLHRQGARLLELGTCTGNMIVQFRDMFPDLEIASVNILAEMANCTLMSDELLPMERIGEAAREAGVAYRQVIGDTMSLDFSAWGFFDAVFIDACHALDHVLSDSRKSLECLRARSVLIWHDYGNNRVPDVTAAVNLLDRELFGGNIVHVLDTTVAFLQFPVRAAPVLVGEQDFHVGG